MAKEPVIIPARAVQRDLAPPRPHLTFSVGSKQYTLELYPRIKVLGTGPAPVLGKRPADIVPIDPKRRR